MLRRLVLAAAIASALVLSARAGAAGDADARERSRAAFRRGVAQAGAGDYAAARDSFQEAYRIFPHPSILLNLGIARAHTGEWLEAEQDLVHFLADDGGAHPEELASARAELAQARGHLGTFRLRVAPDGARAALDGRPVALIPGNFVDVRTTRGAHTLHAEADGFQPIDRAVAVASDRAPNVDVTLAAAGGGPTEPAPGDGRRTMALFFLAGGAVAAGVGVYAGIEAASRANDYNTPGSGHFQDSSTKASGLVFRTSADVAFAGALVLGGVGAYFLLTAPSSAAVQARVVVSPQGLGVAGSF